MNVTIRQLQAFLAVARLTSFVAASRELHVTASALSVLIRELETTTGLRLLDRSTRQVSLSDAGKQFLPYAQRVLMDLEDARRCVMDLKQYRRGAIRIAATQVMFWTSLPGLFSAFNETHPGIRIIPVDVPIDDVLGALESGSADVAVFPERRHATKLQMDYLFETSIHLVCSRHHRLARRKQATWEEICRDPLIFIGNDARVRTRSELDFAFEFEAAYEVGFPTTALGLVAAGLGSAVVTGAIEPVLKPLGLKMLELTEPVLKRRVMMYTAGSRQSPLGVHLFREFASDYFSQRMGRDATADGAAAIGA